jgi:hypothetical protein
MIWRILRSRGFIPIVLILAALVYWKLHPSAPKVLSIGYVADRDVILWNTLAQVRESVGEVHYGDRVEVVGLEGTAVKVRAPSGSIGWVRDSRQLMDSDLWAKGASLLETARALPVQARGRTKTLSNARIEPGRVGKRIYQFGRGTRVLVLKRAVADASQGSEENPAEEKASAAEEQKPKQEDWFLVLRSIDSPPSGDTSTLSGNIATEVKRATTDAVSGGPALTQVGVSTMNVPGGLVAGWVLARFVELDLPGPVKDLASSANLRVIAWFELNRVPDGDGGAVPQYLVAGSRGGEGQACDFSMLRVYTWGTKRKRYETAYVESDLCGGLPIRVSSGAKGPQFQFPDVEEGGADRSYVMIQTSVRRVKDTNSKPLRSRH